MPRSWPEEPFETPIEEMFASQLSKHLRGDASFRNQVSVQTICGEFRLDFLVTVESRSVAFECDGREFHDFSRDEWRDAMILGAEVVDCIYRLRGHDIQNHLDDYLAIVAQIDPELFCERGLANLRNLASDEARQLQLEPEDERMTVHYWDGHPSDAMSVVRRTVRIPAGKRRFWRTAYAFAVEEGGGSVDDLRDEWRRRHGQPQRDV